MLLSRPKTKKYKKVETESDSESEVDYGTFTKTNLDFDIPKTGELSVNTIETFEPGAFSDNELSIDLDISPVKTPIQSPKNLPSKELPVLPAEETSLEPSAPTEPTTILPEQETSLEPSAPILEEEGIEQIALIAPIAPIEQVPNALSQVSSLLAFKVANYSKDQLGKEPLLNVYVVLWLSVDLKPGQISESDSGIIIDEARKISRNTKYCCPETTVLGVQFIGKPDLVQRALVHYQANQGYITSKFDGKFHYEVEELVEEKEYGQPGVGGCMKGIHFYPDLESATKFGGCADCYDEYPIITRRFSQQRQGLIQAIPNSLTKRWFSNTPKDEPFTKWKNSKLITKNWLETIKSFT